MKIGFDFDKTLTERDTLFGFFVFCSEKGFSLIFKVFLFVLVICLYKLRILNNLQMKNCGFYIFIKGMQKEEYKNKCKDFASTLKLTSLVSCLDNYLNGGHQVYIISGSLEDYIKPVFKDLEVVILGSKVDFNDGFLSHLHFNCIAENKVKALQANNIEELDIFFTDSWLDKPLMNISKVSNLVKFNNKKVSYKKITK